VTHRDLGLVLLAAAGLLAVVGVLVLVGAFGWFGRLPGDLRFGGPRVKVWLPLGSMLVLSLLLTLIVNLIARLLGR